MGAVHGGGDACNGVNRNGVVVVLARFRRTGRARPLRQCLVPWRFRRMDTAWRHDHPWPLGCHAEPWRGCTLAPRRSTIRSSRWTGLPRRSELVRTGATMSVPRYLSASHPTSRSTRGWKSASEPGSRQGQRAPRASAHRCRHRHPSHPVRQDHRTGCARHD